MNRSEDQFPLSHVKTVDTNALSPRSKVRVLSNIRNRSKVDSNGMTDSERHLDTIQDKKDTDVLHNIHLRERMSNEPTHVKIRSNG